MLLKNKRFCPLFITQFFGAFNDNMLKTAIMAFITYNLTLNRAHEGMLLNFISILFILPFSFYLPLLDSWLINIIGIKLLKF